MRLYRCVDETSTVDHHPCLCWYREVEPGVWEYRYTGDVMPWAVLDRPWKRIDQTSLEQIASYGHDLQEVQP